MPNESLQKNQPIFAVLLAAYNGMAFIAEQIDSILGQENVEVHIFISVDASSDGTEAFLTKWSQSERRLVLLPFGERFGGAARNFFRLITDVNFSEYDYVALADQDDVWLPRKLFRAHEVISSSGASGYSSNVTAFWPDGRQALIKKSQPQVKWDFLFEAAGPGCTYVLSKDLAFAVKNLLTTHSDKVQMIGLHDWFIYAFARAKSYKWTIDSASGLLYRQHDNNEVGVNMGWQSFVHRAKKLTSGWGLAQAALIAQLLDLENDLFVDRWATGKRLGVLMLGMHANQCRRRVRDRFIFALSCLAIFLTPSRRQ